MEWGGKELGLSDASQEGGREGQLGEQERGGTG